MGPNAGGINVMTFDLSKNNSYFKCPDTVANCDLAGQVKFCMNAYAAAEIPARVGYDIGQPACPVASNDAADQIPLTQDSAFLRRHGNTYQCAAPITGRMR
ncbi:hypothetical protein CcCBS67573_g04768 [Chytriomyces confervae]|uniref:Uncharacterized protein n=1 Tax=Chytriomyces confervae TaxID=246404 RepID=A0A507FDZ1_9FUNG|nr:hypothetical protein CcCBS67573_g04768 [Chytriomyces confervae]